MKKNVSVRFETDRSTSGLCDMLFDELDLLRNNESDAKRANTIAKMASTIVSTKKLELEAARILHGITDIGDTFTGIGLKLGNE